MKLTVLALGALCVAGCAKRPAPLTMSGPEMRKTYYYARRPYGTEAAYNPLTSIVNNGYDQIRTGPEEGRRIFTYMYHKSATSAWQSMIHPRRLVREYGARDWLRFEVFPLSTKAQGGGQWVPNYQLHLFGGGVTYVRLIAWYEQHGVSRPRLAAALTSYAGHFINEMLENAGRTRGSIDAMTDLLIFDPASYLLWNSDRVQRFLGERVELTEWPGQPAIAFPNETLENTFQTTMLRIPLPFTKNWRAFTTMGGSYVVGGSRRAGDSTWVSLGFGWDARTNPVIDPNTGRKTVELLGNVALFIDRNTSLLSSVVLKSGFDAGITINLYPGAFGMPNWSPGLWTQILRDPRGVRFGISSPLGIGVGRNP
jgi:hypothetical protein